MKERLGDNMGDQRELTAGRHGGENLPPLRERHAIPHACPIFLTFGAKT